MPAKACSKPKIKYMECVLNTKCYAKHKSFEKCVKLWKAAFDEGEPDPPCYHEQRMYWMCQHGQWDPRNRWRGNRYADPD